MKVETCCNLLLLEKFFGVGFYMSLFCFLASSGSFWWYFPGLCRKGIVNPWLRDDDSVLFSHAILLLQGPVWNHLRQKTKTPHEHVLLYQKAVPLCC